MGDVHNFQLHHIEENQLSLQRPIQLGQVVIFGRLKRLDGLSDFVY